MKGVQKLLSNALLEICERKSLEYVTVTEIAAHAGLTRQVFYRYFIDKYDLAKFIHFHDFCDVLDQILSGEKRGADMWVDISRAWFDVIKARPQFYQNLYHSGSNGEFRQIIRTYITKFYVGIAQHQLGPQLEPEILFAIQLYLAGATEKINEWIQSPAKTPVEELNRLLYHSMPEKIQNLIILNELDAVAAKKIAQDAYFQSQP